MQEIATGVFEASSVADLSTARKVERGVFSSLPTSFSTRNESSCAMLPVASVIKGYVSPDPVFFFCGFPAVSVYLSARVRERTAL